MKSGDRIGADWRLLVEVGPTLGVCRWRATAGDGTPVEILSPRVEGAMRPAEVRERFVSLHRAVRDAHDPALVRVHEVIQSTTGVWVVRDPLEDATLNDLQGPLDAEAVATIGVALLPAILSLTGALRGVLLGEDIGLDATGRPILAPRGPHDNRVTQAVAGAVPPEVFAGAIPDGRAALYGLGALLYRLAAGRVPPPQQHPPPPASAWNHTVPAALDRALALLLSTDPDQRASALPHLQSLAIEPADLRSHLRPAPSPSALIAQPRAGPGAVPVVLSAQALTTLSPAQRSVAAGLADVPLQALVDLEQARLPLVLERRQTLAQARTRATELTQRHGLPVLAVARRSATAWLGGLLVSGALGLGAVAVFVAVVGVGLSTPLSIVLALLACAALVRGVHWIRGGGRAQHELARAQQAWALIEHGRAARAVWPQVASLDRRIARLRRDLALADLPASADRDVRDALAETSQQLAQRLSILETAARTLASVDPDQLRTRLAALQRTDDPSQHEARDHLVATVAHLDDVQRRVDGQLAEIGQLETALEALAVALDGWTDPHDLPALSERLEQTIRALARPQEVP